MPVADGAKCCSSGSKVYQIAMSTREDQKELSNEEPLGKTRKNFRTRKRRAPLVDAATAPTPIDVEEDVACIRRELPPVDAAKSPSECGEAVPNSGDDVRSVSDSELMDVVDIPEATLEEELLKEVGLSVTAEP